MENLTDLVNACLNLNYSDRKVNFYVFSDTGISDICLDNPKSILRVKAVKILGLSLPIGRVWHAYYSLQDFESNEPLENVIEIPFEVLDRLRHGGDPEFLTLFIHYKDKNKLAVYVKPKH